MFIPLHDDNPTVRTPVVMYALVAANVLAFLATLGLPPLQEQKFVYQHGFVPARLAQLVHAKPITVPLEQLAVDQGGRLVALKRPLQLPPSRPQILLSLLTCMFLHGGWMHLIGNMWFLWIFGNNVEDRLGSLPFLLFYFSGGLLASGCHWLIDPTSTTPVIGASGAIAAVLGAYAITWPWARVHTLVFLLFFITVLEVPALLILGIWFLGQLFSGARELHQAGGVAWWAHVGGFVAGLLLMPQLDALLNGRRRPPFPDVPTLE